MGFEHGQRAMQAGLKCDRVPQIASFSNAFEPHLNIRLAEKSHSLQQDIEAISMQQNEHFDSSRLTRLLLRKSRQGALATLMAGRGDPYCSLVNVASHPDGTPILLISRLAVHTKNILADARVSLMLDERTDSDPLEGARIMLMGRAEEVASDHLEIVRRRYLNAHPSAEAFVDFKDFSFFLIRPANVHLVAGFGRIVDLEPEQFLTFVADAEPLLEAEQGAIAHMNADHRDAINLYATKLLAARPADWRCTGCDPEGLDLAAERLTLRLDFPARVTGPAELRQMLVRLAAEARAKA